MPAVHRVIAFARKSEEGIADLLIACCAAAGGGTSVLTFDRAAARHELFEQL
jgi:predicted nucleic acid-binding protein